MNRRTTGVMFIFISAFLYSFHYLTAAIYGSGFLSLEKKTFITFLDDIGNGLTNASIMSLILGIIYLLYAELEARKKE